VTATNIGHLRIKPANQILQIASNPDFVQLYRQGYTTYYARPGNAMTSAAIVSAGSIGKSSILGNTVNSEVKSGFHYPVVRRRPGRDARQEPDRPAQDARRPGQRRYLGDLSPRRQRLRDRGDVAGPGTITGNSTSALYNTGGVTPAQQPRRGLLRTDQDGRLPAASGNTQGSRRCLDPLSASLPVPPWPSRRRFPSAAARFHSLGL